MRALGKQVGACYGDECPNSVLPGFAYTKEMLSYSRIF